MSNSRADEAHTSSSDRAWIWACVQHPMPLLVEDRGQPTVLERIPPWGDPSLRAYVAKFTDVCESLERFPELRIDFEISAKELEDVARESPATLDRMKSLWQRGKLGFVGGDYAQAHYHVYGAESCLRQIERGLAVFRALIGCEVRVFFHQETGLHEQLPQILRAYGYTVAVPPRFPWALRFTSCPSVEFASHYGTLEFVRDEDLASWQGLDGTTIPLYVSMPAPSLSTEIIEVFRRHADASFRPEEFEERDPFDRFMDRERSKAPVNVPRILIETPDMKRIDESYVAARSAACTFSKLEDALASVVDTRHPIGTVSLYPYWSYIEGVWAEQLSRANRRAETAAYQAEALDALRALVQRRSPNGVESIWENILSSQHHDVYWIETTDLKRRALGWLEQAIDESQSIISASIEGLTGGSTGTTSEPGRFLCVNTLPFHRAGLLELEVPGGLDDERASLLQGTFGDSLVVVPEGEGTGPRRIVLAETTGVSGFGWIDRQQPSRSSSSTRRPRSTTSESFEAETDRYRIRIRHGGIIESLTERVSGVEVIGSSGAVGNELRAKLEDGTWISSRDITTPLEILETPVASIVSVHGRLGPIGLHEDIVISRWCARIDFRMTLDFGRAPISVGDFWDDTTKLNVYWPIRSTGHVVHDIPFGVVSARSGRPVFCTTFLDTSDDRAGFAYFNRGTTKHWMDGGVLANVLAWGGRKFSNRHPGLWEHVDLYDLRLVGSQTIEYAILPHPGDYREGNVPREAQQYTTPLVAVGPIAGIAPQMKAVTGIELAPPNLVCTAILPDVDGLKLRVFESFGRAVRSEDVLGSCSFANCTIRDLGGREIETIRPFQICCIHLRR